MKIGSAAAYRPYQAVTTGGVPLEAAAGSVKLETAAKSNKDQVTLSGDASFRSVLARMSGAIAEDVQSAVTPERLEELKNEVENKTYYVPSAQLADAMLDASV